MSRPYFGDDIFVPSDYGFYDCATPPRTKSQDLRLTPEQQAEKDAREEAERERRRAFMRRVCDRVRAHLRRESDYALRRDLELYEAGGGNGEVVPSGWERFAALVRFDDATRDPEWREYERLRAKFAEAEKGRTRDR